MGYYVLKCMIFRYFFPSVYMIISDLIGCQSCEKIISVFIVP